MHPWVLQEFARLHNAELDHQADLDRLASVARSAHRDVGQPAGRPYGRSIVEHLAYLFFGVRRGPHPKGH